MKKLVYQDYRNEESTIGFKEEVIWKITDYCNGPKKSGEYLTSDGKGNIKNIYSTGDDRDATKELFDKILDGCEYENATWSDTNEFLSNDDLIDLYRSHHVWYTINEYYKEDWGSCYDLEILRGKDIPKYFLETNVSGPIDKQVNEYDKTVVDLDYQEIKNP